MNDEPSTQELYEYLRWLRTQRGNNPSDAWWDTYYALEDELLARSL